MRIICDMDEVIVDLMTPVLRLYNKKYQSDIKIEDIAQWELPKDMKDMFYNYSLFFELKSLNGSVDGLETLKRWGHDVVLATNYIGDPHIAFDKVMWVSEYLPKGFSDNLILTARKDLLQGDVIIDDNADYLIGSPCPIKICMDRPWNRKLEERGWIDITAHGEIPRYIPGLGDIDYRVQNWQEILSLFEGGL